MRTTRNILFFSLSCLVSITLPNLLFAQQKPDFSAAGLTFITLPAVRVAAVSRLGPRSESRSAFYDLYSRAAPAGLVTGNSVFFGLAHDRFDRSTINRSHYQAGVAVTGNIDPSLGLDTIEVPGGRYAMARYVGHPEGLGSIYRAMEASITNHGLSIADSPRLEVSMTPPLVTPPSEEIIYVLFPLKSRGL